MAYRGKKKKKKKKKFETSLELSDHMKLHSPIRSNPFCPSIDTFSNVEMMRSQTHPFADQVKFPISVNAQCESLEDKFVDDDTVHK